MRKLSEEHKRKISESSPKIWLGKKFSQEHKDNLSKGRMGKNLGNDNGFKKGMKPWNKGKPYLQIMGSKNPNWISDRSLLKDEHKDRGGQLHREWSKSIKKRDGWKCKINNNCTGKVVAHHILTWREYPNERYNINNGITLCQAHHPKKRAEEKLLAPTFQELIGQMN